MVHAAPSDEEDVSDTLKEDRARPRPRIQADITMDGGNCAAVPCQVENLSRSGICVVTRDPIMRGRGVYIDLHPPEGLIVLIGETMWVRPVGESRYEVGCWHAPDGAESRERLYELLGDYLVTEPTL